MNTKLKLCAVVAALLLSGCDRIEYANAQQKAWEKWERERLQAWTVIEAHAYYEAQGEAERAGVPFDRAAYCRKAFPDRTEPFGCVGYPRDKVTK